MVMMMMMSMPPSRSGGGRASCLPGTLACSDAVRQLRMYGLLHWICSGHGTSPHSVRLGGCAHRLGTASRPESSLSLMSLPRRAMSSGNTSWILSSLRRQTAGLREQARVLRLFRALIPRKTHHHVQQRVHLSFPVKTSALVDADKSQVFQPNKS